MPIFTHSQVNCDRIVKREAYSSYSGTVRIAQYQKQDILVCETDYTFQVAEWLGGSTKTQISLWSENADKEGVPDYMLVDSVLSGYKHNGNWGIIWYGGCFFGTSHNRAVARFMREFCDEILVSMRETLP